MSKLADKQARFAERQAAKRQRISAKEAVKAFDLPIKKHGAEWVIQDGGREIRNRDKKAAIMDWYTLRGFEVIDG